MRTLMAGILIILAGGLALGGWTAQAEDSEKVFSGAITTVDLDARSMALKDPQAGEVTIKVPDGAVIVLDGDSEAILDDLFEGDMVKEAAVRKGEDGKWVLVKAVVTSQVDEPGEGEEEEPEEDSTAK